MGMEKAGISVVHEVLHHGQRGFFLSWEAEEAWEEAASQLEMNSVGSTGC